MMSDRCIAPQRPPIMFASGQPEHDCCPEVQCIAQWLMSLPGLCLVAIAGMDRLQ